MTPTFRARRGSSPTFPSVLSSRPTRPRPLICSCRLVRSRLVGHDRRPDRPQSSGLRGLPRGRLAGGQTHRDLHLRPGRVHAGPGGLFLWVSRWRFFWGSGAEWTRIRCLGDHAQSSPGRSRFRKQVVSWPWSRSLVGIGHPDWPRTGAWGFQKRWNHQSSTASPRARGSSPMKANRQ